MQLDDHAATKRARMDNVYGASCDPWILPKLPHVLEEPGSGGCRPGMTRVDSFCIDRFEASLVRVTDGGTTEPWSPYLNPGSERVRAVSVRGAVPQGYISGQRAALACAAAGKRLCTDGEWIRACMGPSKNTYPYGAVRVPGACNDARKVHPALELFGTGEAWIWSELSNPCLNQLPDSLDPTGANVACVTAEGVYDMMGNLHEWTADPNGTMRGGYYVDTRLNGEGCNYVTTAHKTNHWDYSTGFRCCS
jgi:sulfatase modifying factor 1